VTIRLEAGVQASEIDPLTAAVTSGTVIVHEPRASICTGVVGQTIVGGWASRTLILKEHADVLPTESVAVQVTVCEVPASNL
jgi:hypothetical protein